MKLRNKKTGAIYDVFLREREVGGYPCIIVCDKKAYTQSKTKFGVTNYVLDEYSSLAELNEEWEDYTPAEPLIKDEKIRKAVRAWAEAMGLDAVDYEEGEFGIVFYSTDNMDDCKYRIEFSQYLDYLKSGYDSIADLCGEEE